MNYGKIGKLSLIYFPFALLEIITAYTTSTSGELNLSGWVSGILGLIVCFPWFIVGMGIIDLLSLDLDENFSLVFIVSTLINIILLYFYDGMNYRRKLKKGLSEER